MLLHFLGFATRLEFRETSHSLRVVAKLKVRDLFWKEGLETAKSGLRSPFPSLSQVSPNKNSGRTSTIQFRDLLPQAVIFNSFATFSLPYVIFYFFQQVKDDFCLSSSFYVIFSTSTFPVTLDIVTSIYQSITSFIFSADLSLLLIISLSLR